MKFLFFIIFLTFNNAFALEVTSEMQLERIDTQNLQQQLQSYLVPSVACMVDPDGQTLYEKYPEEIYKIREMLFNDNTDSIPYELGHFSCHNYAKRLYLQHSSNVTSLDPYKITDMEREWGVEIKRDDSAKYDIFVINLISPEDGFFHSINAVLLDKDKPDDINSYVFIEPQSDKLLLASEIRAHGSRLFNKTLQAPITVDISTFDEFKFNGNIWQTFSSTKHTFTDN